MSDITIKDIARRANVSIATVSRVINKEAGVRPKTIEKVERAIQECQYVPNSIARNLKSSTSKTVGLLVSDISNNHFTLMAKVIEMVLREHGYNLIICNTDDSQEQELMYLNRLVGFRVDGLILNITNQNNDYITRLSHSLPVVLVERSISDPNFRGDYIGSNNQAGIEMMTKYLISNGHQRIGIINSELKVSTGRERLAGFINTMKSIGVAVDEHYPYRYDAKLFNLEGGILGCRHLMGLQEPPTAIVVTNNAMSLGVYKYLRTNTIAIPDDVSVLSYGDIENSELFFVKPGYATLNPSFTGETAATHLLSRMSDSGIRTREVILEPSLIVRDSVKAV